MKQNLLVTLADRNYIGQAKQLFSSVYFNAGWKGDYMLLAHEIPEKDLKWFRDKGILVKKCKSLYTPSLGELKYPLVVLDKFYLFTPEFKKWKNIIFLDADIIVKYSLDYLTKIKGLASVNITKQTLRYYFDCSEDTKEIQKLNKKYNLKKFALNSGVMAFSAKIIQDDSFNKLNNLLDEYKNIASGDDPIINLLFYDKWIRLPIIFDLSPEFFRELNNFIKFSKKGIILHLKVGDFWNKKSSFFKELKNNLEKAEQINLNNIPNGRKMNSLQIYLDNLYLILNIKIESIHYHFSLIKKKSFNLISRSLGIIGFLLKKYTPQLYYRLKKIK